MRILIFHPKSQEFDCNSWESIYMSCWIFMERLKHLVVQLCFSFYPFTSMFSVVVWLLLPKVLPKLFFPLFFFPKACSDQMSENCTQISIVLRYNISCLKYFRDKEYFSRFYACYRLHACNRVILQ